MPLERMRHVLLHSAFSAYDCYLYRIEMEDELIKLSEE